MSTRMTYERSTKVLITTSMASARQMAEPRKWRRRRNATKTRTRVLITAISLRTSRMPAHRLSVTSSGSNWM